MQEYFKAKGINSSSLIRFNDCPDKVDEYTPAKYEFTLGHALEDLLTDYATGSNLFQEKYFVGDEGKTFNFAAETKGSCLPEWIDKKIDLSKKDKLNNSGVRHGSYKLYHFWLDKCQENPGKQPISDADYQMLMIQRNYMLNMEIEHVGKLDDFIKHCEFQVPIYWDGKKALIDMLLRLEKPDEVIIFDVKNYRSLSSFETTLRQKQWIQDYHYCEAANSAYSGECYKPMIFLVASKSEKEGYMCQPFVLSPLLDLSAYDMENRFSGEIAYKELVEQYKKWDLAGRVKTGSKKLKIVKKYWG